MNEIANHVAVAFYQLGSVSDLVHQYLEQRERFMQR